MSSLAATAGVILVIGVMLTTPTTALAAAKCDTYQVDIVSNGTETGDYFPIDVETPNGQGPGYEIQWGDNTPEQNLVFSRVSGVDTTPSGTHVSWVVRDPNIITKQDRKAAAGNSLFSAVFCAHVRTAATTTTTKVRTPTTNRSSDPVRSGGRTGPTPTQAVAVLPRTGKNTSTYARIGALLLATGLFVEFLIRTQRPAARFHRRPR